MSPSSKPNVMPRQKPGQSRQDYATPARFISAVKTRLGIDDFAVDLAADRWNAKAAMYLTKEQDSLGVDWRELLALGDRWMWLNPPFANIDPWAEKCAGARPLKIAFLAPAGSPNWFRDHVDGKAFVLMLNGRLSFDGVGPYPKDCILALYGVAPGYEVWDWQATLAKGRNGNHGS